MWRLDVLVAAVLTVIAQVEIWSPELVPGVGDVTGSRPLLTVTTLVMTAPLAARRHAPLAVLVAVLGAGVVQQVVTTPTEGLATLAATLIATYSSSAHSAPTRAAVAGVLTPLGSAGLGENFDDHVFIAIVLGAAWLMGFVVGLRTDQVNRLAEDKTALQERLDHAAHVLAEAEQRQSRIEPSTKALSSLTRRELDIVREIARGLSNAEIAASLVISEWTVKTHVASVLRKLGLRDRAQVVVAAYESGLVRPQS